MRFLRTPLPGAFVIELEPIEDERGFFARSFCHNELAEAGLDFELMQASVSFNRKRGTLRGLHYQDRPCDEIKLVRCTAGSLWDVIVDIREESPTRYRWFSTELSSENRRTLYVPQGFAHGFQTLVDNCEVSYLISKSYRPDLARGLRWDDPLLQIPWPLADPILSPRDRSFPLISA